MLMENNRKQPSTTVSWFVKFNFERILLSCEQLKKGGVSWRFITYTAKESFIIYEITVKKKFRFFIFL